MHPTPPALPLRAADGLAWAIFFIGISTALTLAAVLLFILVDGPIDGISWSSSADMFAFLAYSAAEFIIIPVAFHRRKWWAWDAAMANLILLWPCVPLLATVLIAPSKPDDPTPMSVGVRIALGLLLAIGILPPFLGSTRLLTRPEVCAVFAAPSGLPGGVRVVAAYQLFYVPFKFLEAISPSPQILFGIPLPGWRGWLWSALVSGLFAVAGFGLYRHQKIGRIAALAAVVLITVQGVAGLLNPSLSSVPPASVGVQAAMNCIYVATGIAAGITLIRHSKQKVPRP